MNKEIRSNAEGPYRIAVVHDYYGPKTTWNWLDEEDGHNVAEFDGLAEARDRVDELYRELYVTQNGEAGRPSYYIVAQRDIMWVEHDDDDKFNWDGYDGSEDDDDARYEYANDQTISYIKGHAVEED